eukprot:Clim_evm42s157 gene=Clim_evmTU42s157
MSFNPEEFSVELRREEEIRRANGTLEERIWYFSFGSNMNAKNLEFKKIHVLESRRAIVHDWELVFNLHTQSRVDPSMANMMPKLGASTHGVAHLMDWRFKCILDAIEASYEKVKAKVEWYEEDLPEGAEKTGVVILYSATERSALANGATLQTTPPSRRYLDLLITGAQDFNLAPEWIERLKNQESVPYPKLTWNEDEVSKVLTRCWSIDEIEQYSAMAQAGKEKPKYLVAIAGVVFDLENENRVFVKRFISGKEVGLLMAGRCVEGPKDNLAKLSKNQWDYIYAWVQEGKEKYDIVGHTEALHPYKTLQGVSLPKCPCLISTGNS